MVGGRFSLVVMSERGEVLRGLATRFKSSGQIFRGCEEFA